MQVWKPLGGGVQALSLVSIWGIYALPDWSWQPANAQEGKASLKMRPNYKKQSLDREVLQE